MFFGFFFAYLSNVNVSEYYIQFIKIQFIKEIKSYPSLPPPV